MAALMIWAAVAIAAIVAVGLVRVLCGPTRADSMMAAQLIGTGGIAVLLLIGVAAGAPAVVDVALALALLSAFAGVGFVLGGARR
ncbi:MAG: multiple resistance and pH regulation protein F [Rhodobacteraceae bacterium]|nr:MAG: multiple resistance and pH regulation protein F [Paracoccaceae bacterium]